MELVNLAVLAHAECLEQVPGGRGGGYDRHQNPSQEHTISALDSVRIVCVRLTRITPSMMRPMPAQRRTETCSCRNMRPAKAESTYPMPVTGMTKLKSA